MQALFKDDEGRMPTEFGDNRMGKEVGQPPLCAICSVDVEVDGVSSGGLIQRGLKRIDVVDKGITRQRWEAKDAMGSSRGLANEARPASHDQNSAAPLGVVDTHRSIAFDGKGGHFVPTIWVDISDPINRPAFEPSPLKPVPQFMQGHAGQLQFPVQPSRRCKSLGMDLHN